MTRRVPILQVAADLNPGKPPQTAATEAIQVVVTWLRNKQRLSLPSGADDGEAFEVDLADGMPVTAERAGNYWALQYDKADESVPGRTWRTECSVAFDGSIARAGIRLSVLDLHAERSYPVTIPRVVGDLTKKPGLFDAGVGLADTPRHIIRQPNVAALAALLLNPNRALPVVAFSSTPKDSLIGEARYLAARLAGIAHVVVLGVDERWALSDALGREFSVYGGAVRTYWSHLDPAKDERTYHPLATQDWIGRRFGGFKGFSEALIRQLARRTVLAHDIDDQLPPFREVRRLSVQRRVSRVSNETLGEGDEIRRLQAENSALTKELQDALAEYEYADSEVKAAQADREKYRWQLENARQKIATLEAKLSEDAKRIRYPETLSEIDEWCAQHFPDRLVLLNRAARAARKSTFRDVALVYACIERLAREYVDSRRLGRPTERLFDDLGVRLELTGDPAHLSQWSEQYFVDYGRAKRFLSQHLKKGSDKNDIHTLRIYFFYDEDEEVVVIGHLPSHLQNALT